MGQRKQQLEVEQNARRMVALILGGGRGTRLFPLTLERAKPAVPLSGRYRLVDIPISNCIHSNVNRIFLLTQFNSTSLHRHITHTYKFDNFSNGFVEILAAEQTTESGDWYQGTADAIRQHLKHIGNQHASHYLILAGDHLYRMDYREMLETHLANDADITVSVLPVNKRAAKSFGVLKVRKDGRIAQFFEKPSTEDQLVNLVTPPEVFENFGLQAGGKEYLASMGMYIFKPHVMESLLREHKEWVDFGKDVIPNSLKGFRVYSHIFHGYWEDIGTIRSYYETSLQMVQANPHFTFHTAGKPIYTRPRYLPGPRIQDAQVKDSIICEGSHIHSATITQSIVGIRMIVQPGVVIESSIIMGNDFYVGERERKFTIPMGIGQGSRISRAIIDKNACIGKNVIIQGSDELPDSDGENYAIRDGIVIIPKNAVIPDGTKIGAA
ncbi:MAG: glucose-1-phosphate adenylyltransferase [Candidatus Hydrogenedentota bacterium]